jgi:hypothetical protein
MWAWRSFSLPMQGVASKKARDATQEVQENNKTECRHRVWRKKNKARVKIARLSQQQHEVQTQGVADSKKIPGGQTAGLSCVAGAPTARLAARLQHVTGTLYISI